LQYVLQQGGAGYWVDVTESSCPPYLPVRYLAYVSGAGQVASVNDLLPLPLVVRVTDGNGTPVSGAEISWSVTGAPGNASGQSVSPASSITGADGLASADMILGSEYGSYQVTATCPTCAGGSPQAFSVIALSSDLASKGQTCNSTSVRSQVNFGSGNLFDSIDLLTIPGAEPNVTLSLSYNSLETVAGSLGPGWTHSYAMTVTSEGGDFLTLKEEDGRRILFHETSPGSNNYTPWDQFGRTGTTIRKFTDGTYRMTRKDGTQYDFNASGALTRITGRNANALFLGYAGSNPETITDSYGRVTLLGYDGNRLATVTDPAGRVTRIGYDTNGYLRTVTDNVSRTTYYDYDANGRLYSKTDPLNGTTIYDYTPQGELYSATDNATGVAAWIEYFPEQNMAIFHQRNGGTKTVEYDPALDMPVRVTQADDNVVLYGYDNTGRLTSVSGPGQYSLNRAYIGNVTYETDGLGRTSVYTYNDFGQLTQVQGPEGRTTVYHYDARGILDSVQNANGETTYFEVDVDPYG